MVKNLLLKNFSGLLLVTLLFLSMGSWGQSIWTNPITGTNPNTSNPYTTGDVKDSNITVSGIGRGAGITGSGANDRYNAISWNTAAIDLTAYFEFTLTPASGYRINLASFVYTGQASGTGATNFQIRSSTDGYTASIGTPNATGTTISLSGTAYQNLTSATTFRLYGWGASASGGTFSINSFTFNGTVQSLIVPDVTTATVSNITATAATAGGDATADNGSAITAKGVVWGTATAPTVALATKTNDGTGTGAFTSSITGLTANTRYYYRAYATNAIGATSYGTEYDFYTAAIVPGAPVLSNPQLTSIDATVDANGNGATVLYAIRLNGTSYVAADGSLTGTPVYQTATAWSTVTITGLTSGTTYTVDVAAQNTALATTAYGATAALATLDASAPALSLDSTSLDFGAVCINATASGSFTFSGSNISGTADITVAALAGYSYALTQDGTYTDTLTITGFTGAPTTVYVLFSPSAVQSYDGTIAVSGADANATAQFSASATGSGINTLNTVTTITSATAIGGATATITAAFTTGCASITATEFEYSTVSFANGTGTTVAATSTTASGYSTVLTGLSPSTRYYYKAKITDANGTTYGFQASFVTTQLDAPVAAAATGITPASFTANWLSVPTATSYLLSVSTSPAFGTGTLATDLFISEYTEGSSNNKYIEIYNGTGNTADLSDYRLILYANGAAANSPTNDVQLSGVLLNGQTIVYKNSGATIYGGATADNSAANFNGDDAIALYKNSTASYVDIFGQIGNDPGTAWTATGFTTVDRTLRRKANVTGGVTTNPTSGFPTLATEWDSYSTDNVADLGSHTYSSFTPSYVAGYQNAPVSDTTADVTGLSQNTTYYYKVKAVSASSTSKNSNVIDLTTTIGTVTWVIQNGETSPQWVPAATPSSTISAIIAADYDTATYGGFTANNLTVSSGYALTVNPNTTVTLYGSVTNNAGVDNFVVEDNGALVQRGTGTNATPVTVIKNSNPLYRLDYTLWSAPTTGQTLRQFSLGTSNNRFYEYVSSATADEGYYPVDPLTTYFDAASQGKGFLIRMPNLVTENGTTFQADYAAGTASYTFEGTFKGTPNTGDITYPLFDEGGRYTAIGNPYPSPINLAAFYDANTAVIDQGSAIYFWRKKNSTTATGSYATLTLADFNANDSGDNQSESTGGQDNEIYFPGATPGTWAIAPGQGFIVQTDSAAPASPEVTFTNAMRQAAPSSGGQAFFKSGVSQASRFRMKVTTPAGGSSQMSVVYMPQGTLGIDYGYDGKKLGESGVSLYTYAQNTILSIQARPEFEATDVVPVGFTAVTAGNHTIALSHTDGIFANGQKIYLKDNAEGVIRDMSLGGYTFTSEAGTFEGRFEVVYTTAALGTDIPVLDANTVIVYQNGGTININSGSAIISSVNVFDIRGRKLHSADKVNATEAAVSNLTAAQQVLVVEINTDKGTVTKKIVF